MASLVAVFLLALTGCTPVKVRLGWKVYLDKIPISSIEASLPKGPGIAPGEKSPLMVVITQPDGKVLQTEGVGHGKVLWKDLRITASVVTANQKGILSLPRDPRISDGKVGHVTITVPSHPDIRTELDIPLRYDYKFSANFPGSSGSNGMDGSNGLDGSSGSMGSIDPNNPSPGGDGSDGQWLGWPEWSTWQRCAAGADPGGGPVREPSPFLHRATKSCSWWIPREVP